jgi:hypothetical protein
LNKGQRKKRRKKHVQNLNTWKETEIKWDCNVEERKRRTGRRKAERERERETDIKVRIEINLTLIIILNFFSVALRPDAGHGLLILEVSKSHPTTYHGR